MRRQTAIIAGLLAGGTAIVLASETGVTSRLLQDAASPTTATETGAAEVAAPIVLAQADTSATGTDTAVETDTTEAQATPETGEAEIERLHALLAEREAELAGLRADLETQQSESGDLRAELERREAELARLEDELKILRGDADAPQAVALQAPEIEDTGELDALRDDGAGLDAALDAAKAPSAAQAATPPDPDTPLTEVHFEIASAQLTPGGLVRALEAARAATELNLVKIRVTGHTDRVGPPDFNRRLSAARAESVVAVLVEAGLPRDSIEIEPMGEAPDLAPISTEDGVSEPLNRCVGIYPGSIQTAMN